MSRGRRYVHLWPDAKTRKVAREAAGVPEQHPRQMAPVHNIAPLITYVCCDCGATNAKPCDVVGRECWCCGSKQERRADKPSRSHGCFAFRFSLEQLEAMWARMKARG